MGCRIFQGVRMRALYELSGEFIRLYEDAFQQSGDDGAIPEDLAESLKGIEGDFVTKGESCLMMTRSWLAHAEALRAEAKRLADAAARLEGRVDWMKRYVKEQMEVVGMDKFRGRILGARIQKNSQPRIEAKDLMRVPPAYYYHPPVELDKRKVLEAIKAGKTVEGVTVETGTHLRITE